VIKKRRVLFVSLVSVMLFVGGIFLWLRMDGCKTRLVARSDGEKVTYRCGLYFDAIGGESSMRDVYLGQFKKLFAVGENVFIKINFGDFAVDFPVAYDENKGSFYVFESDKDDYLYRLGEYRPVIHQIDKNNPSKGLEKYKNSFLTIDVISPKYSVEYGKFLEKMGDEENVDEEKKMIITEEIKYYTECDEERKRFSEIMKRTDRLGRVLGGWMIRLDNNIKKCLPKISSVEVYL